MIDDVLNNRRPWHVETIHVLDGLRMLPDGCVQTVCTSPPYWGLRDYGVPPSIWGGDENCEHEWESHVQPAANGIRHDGGMSGETLSSGSATRKPKKSAFCRKCPAWLGCYGLEPMPEMFIANSVLIFREVRRVLRDDGTLWLNIGDSWNAYNGGSGPGGWNDARDSERPQLETGYGLRCKNLKPKDLCGIPWRVALALQSDGWYLRQDIIWAKPNGMPESVRDRCTKSHEYVFLLTKSERYFYDRLAISEPMKPSSLDRVGQDVANQEGSSRANGGAKTNGNMKAVKFGGNKAEGYGTRIASGNEWEPADSANKRSVWSIAVGTFKGAHFAVMPMKLAETCLKAGTSARGCCADCGAPWERVTESERVATRPGTKTKLSGGSYAPPGQSPHSNARKVKTIGPNSRMLKNRDPAHEENRDREDQWDSSVTGNRDPERHVTQTVTTGWQPTCKCNADTMPCLALDTFNGAGTTGLVAAKGMGLRYIGFEVNSDYADLARTRINRGLCDDAPRSAESAPGQAVLF